jgi:hypothetical protein
MRLGLKHLYYDTSGANEAPNFVPYGIAVF